jgi:tetratricopeptide (TPR) repeat protein
MLAAGAITLAAMISNRQVRIPFRAIGATLMLSMVIVVWAGFSGPLGSRVATLFNSSLMQDGRWGNWSDGARAATDSWLLGTGLGTYGYAYRPFQQRLDEGWYHSAENQYLEAFVAGGLPALLLVLCAIVLMFCSIRVLLKSDLVPANDGIAYVGLFALISQVLHAFFDYGLYLPANMIAFALICGALCGRAIRVVPRVRSAVWIALPPLRSRAWTVALIGALLFNGWIGYREVAAAASVSLAGRDVPLVLTPTRISRSEADVGIERLRTALDSRPDDAEGQRKLANLWAYRYRLAAYTALGGQFDADGGILDHPTWDLTDPATTHRRANEFFRNGQQKEFQEFREHPLIAGNLRPAAECYSATLRACPVFPYADLGVAEFGFLLDQRAPNDERHLIRAAALQPSNPGVLFSAGFLANSAGHDRLARACWRRSLSLTSRYLKPIVSNLSERMPLENIIEEVLPDSPEMLLQLARARYQGPRKERDCQLLVERARQLLETQRETLSEGNWYYLTGLAGELEQRPSEAIRAYRLALKCEPSQTQWRYRLALILQEQGRWEEAHQEATTLCMTDSANRPSFEELLRRLNKHRLRQLAE